MSPRTRGEATGTGVQRLGPALMGHQPRADVLVPDARVASTGFDITGGSKCEPHATDVATKAIKII